MQECRDKTKLNVNPLSEPPGASLRAGGGVGAMVSVPHDKLEYKVEKLIHKTFRSCSRGSQSNPKLLVGK